MEPPTGQLSLFYLASIRYILFNNFLANRVPVRDFWWWGRLLFTILRPRTIIRKGNVFFYQYFVLCYSIHTSNGDVFNR